MQARLSFKAYRALVESHDFSNLTPYHQYKTEDGHDVHVHVFRDGDHKTAIFHNNTLGAITKIVSFPHSSNLSKEELMHAGKEVKHDGSDHRNCICNKHGTTGTLPTSLNRRF
jgi:hypothetical protein